MNDNSGKYLSHRLSFKIVSLGKLYRIPAIRRLRLTEHSCVYKNTGPGEVMAFFLALQNINQIVIYVKFNPTF